MLDGELASQQGEHERKLNTEMRRIRKIAENFLESSAGVQSAVEPA
jgi:hypothetical protein